MSTATAAWDLDVLVGALARVGWGPLADEIRGARTTLKALSDVLPHGSAHGVTTTEQLAAVAGMSDRWTRHCLALLERVGVLRWRRGWRRVPGRFTLCKRTIAAWVRAARKQINEQRAARKARKAARPTQPARPAGPGRRGVDLAAGVGKLNRNSLPDSPLKSEVTAADYVAPPVPPRHIWETNKPNRSAQRAALPPDASPATPEHAQRSLAAIRATLAKTKQRKAYQ